MIHKDIGRSIATLIEREVGVTGLEVTLLTGSSRGLEFSIAGQPHAVSRALVWVGSNLKRSTEYEYLGNDEDFAVGYVYES